MKQKIMNSTILTNETGRSMVEMLGVLAIAGVLSVGGVYGYGVAMKKHKANELLHQASINAVQIASQIATGKESGFGLENFGTSNGSFNQPTYDKSTGKFTMKITGMDSAVCEQMGNMAGGILRDATCDGTTLTLTYYGNLATNDADGQAGIPSGGSGGAGGDTKPSCPEGSSTSGTGGFTGIKIDGEMCQCDDASAVYTSGGCEVRTSDTCTDHTTNECGLGYYCKFSPTLSPTDCYDSNRGDGVCTAISGGTQKGGHWVGPNLDWWSANSWCIGKGSTGLITYSTLQSAYGCNTLSYYCDLDALNADGLSDYYYYWSAEDNGDDCFAWFVFLGNNGDYFSYDRDRHNVRSYALCE